MRELLKSFVCCKYIVKRPDSFPTVESRMFQPWVVTTEESVVGLLSFFVEQGQQVGQLFQPGGAGFFCPYSSVIAIGSQRGILCITIETFWSLVSTDATPVNDSIKRTSDWFVWLISSCCIVSCCRYKVAWLMNYVIDCHCVAFITVLNKQQQCPVVKLHQMVMENRQL